jgi:transposase
MSKNEEGLSVVVRIVRSKFVHVQRTGAQDETSEHDAPAVFIAEPPERPIERGLAGPGLLAKTVVYRWQDHLPLYRQSSIHARDGLRRLAALASRDLHHPRRQAQGAPALASKACCARTNGP